MKLRVKQLTDNDITQYCEIVDTILTSFNERTLKKKGKKQLEPEGEEDYVVPDEDMFVMS